MHALGRESDDESLSDILYHLRDEPFSHTNKKKKRDRQRKAEKSSSELMILL